MKLIETYNGSGFYAQYATSADYDSLGNPLSSYMVESKFGFNNNLITGYNGSGFAGEGGGDSDIFIVTKTTTQKEVADNSGKALFYKDDNGITYPLTNKIPSVGDKTMFEFKGLENSSTVNTIDLISDPLSNDPISPSSVSSNYLIIGTNYSEYVPLNVSGTYIYNGTSDVQEPKHGGEFNVVYVSGDNFDLDIRSLYYNPTDSGRSATRPIIVNGEEVQWTNEHNAYHIHLTISGLTTIDHNEPPQNASVGCGAALYSNEKYGGLFSISNAVSFSFKNYNGLTFTATDNSDIGIYSVNSNNRHLSEDEFCYEKWYGGPFTISEPIYVPTFANNEEKDQGYLYTTPIEDSGEDCEVNWVLTPVTSYDTGYVLTAAPDAITGLKINNRIYRFPSNNFTYRNI